VGSKTAVTLAGSPVKNLEGITINIDQGIEDRPTLNSTGSLTDIFRQNFYGGLTVDIPSIQIDREDYIENFAGETEIGDIVIKMDDSAATEKRMCKITLQDCRVLNAPSAIGMDNAIIINNTTVKPTFDGTNDPLKIQYSTKTSGGYTGW